MMRELTKNNAAQVLDLFTARCAFERVGVKLYDAAIAKIERSAEPRYHVILNQLRSIRDEEKEHEEWLEAQIRALGGDPHAQTTFTQLEAEESQGIKTVIIDGHQQVSHILHALVTAELADNAGWDLLVKLATEAGDQDARRELQKRLVEEAKHLVYLREALHTAAEIEILGRKKEMPRSLPRALARRKSVIALVVASVAGAVAAGWRAFRAGRRAARRLERA